MKNKNDAEMIGWNNGCEKMKKEVLAEIDNMIIEERAYTKYVLKELKERVEKL